MGLVVLFGAAVTGLLAFGPKANARPWLLGAAWALAALGVVAMTLAERSSVGVPLGTLLSSEAGGKFVLLAVAVAIAGVAALAAALQAGARHPDGARASRRPARCSRERRAATRQGSRSPSPRSGCTSSGSERGSAGSCGWSSGSFGDSSRRRCAALLAAGGGRARGRGGLRRVAVDERARVGVAAAPVAERLQHDARREAHDRRGAHRARRGEPVPQRRSVRAAWAAPGPPHRRRRARARGLRVRRDRPAHRSPAAAERRGAARTPAARREGFGLRHDHDASNSGSPPAPSARTRSPRA